MKVPLKNRALSAYPEDPRNLSPLEEVKVFDYAHEEPLLGEIAGHVFNRYLRFRKTKTPFGVRLEYRFGSSNPTKAMLHLHQVVDDMDVRQSQGRVEEHLYEDACEELLYKAFEAIDAMHKLDNSFFDRIKYAFQGRQ